MNRALFNRRARQLHLWLGLAIGAQVGLWLISGLFMTWFPIEEVRGEHLRAEAEPAVFANMSGLLTPDAIIEKSEIAARQSFPASSAGKAGLACQRQRRTKAG